MPTAAVQKSVLDNYLTGPGKALNRAGDFAGRAEHMIMIPGYLSTLGQHIHTLRGDTESSQKWGEAANLFDTIRGGLNAFRIVFPMEKLITGKWLYQQYSYNDELEARKMGLNWIVEGGWKRQKLDPVSQKMVDDPTGDRVKRDLLDIIMFILVLVARTLSPFNFLHSKKVINLGQHAKGMGAASMGCWAIILPIDCVQSARELYKSKTPLEVKLNTFGLVESGLSVVSFPSDCGVGMKKPVTGIIGSVLCIVYPAWALFRWLILYR